MTTFQRSGHWRYSSLGYRHWVREHSVDRDDWSTSWSYNLVAPTPSPVTIAPPSSCLDPNARCPVCGAEVFFYSNEFGSKVYFDDLGPPWPKHPCTDSSAAVVAIPRGVADRKNSSLIRDLITPGSNEGSVRIPGVFVVLAVEKRGPKRMVTLEEIGGERIEILLSPPAPPINALAVPRGFELYWFDPQKGNTGKNLVWRRT